MGLEVMITKAITSILENAVEEYTLQQLKQAVSSLLGVRVSDKDIRKSLHRNCHRITIEAGRIALSFDYSFKERKD